MIDGITDLLTAILVLGIVVAIAFGFIIPLTQNDLMQYDSEYQDKGILSTTADYSDPDKLATMNKRLYTFEEMVLLLYVQDEKMEEPKGINFRNMVYGNPYSDNANLRKDKFNLSNLNALPDSLSVSERTQLINDGVYKALLYYGENGMDILTKTYSVAKNKQNVGVFRITGKFFTNFEGESNLAQLMSTSALGNTYTVNGPLDSVPESDPEYANYVHSMEQYNARRIFHVGYHFALPDGSTSIDGTKTSKYIKAMNAAKYHKNYDEENMHFVEIQGNWPLGSTNYVDTYQDYKNFIADVKEKVDTTVS